MGKNFAAVCVFCAQLFWGLTALAQAPDRTEPMPTVLDLLFHPNIGVVFHNEALLRRTYPFPLEPGSHLEIARQRVANALPGDLESSWMLGIRAEMARRDGDIELASQLTAKMKQRCIARPYRHTDGNGAVHLFDLCQAIAALGELRDSQARNGYSEPPPDFETSPFLSIVAPFDEAHRGGVPYTSDVEFFLTIARHYLRGYTAQKNMATLITLAQRDPSQIGTLLEQTRVALTTGRLASARDGAAAAQILVGPLPPVVEGRGTYDQIAANTLKTHTELAFARLADGENRLPEGPGYGPKDLEIYRTLQVLEQANFLMSETQVGQSLVDAETQFSWLETHYRSLRYSVGNVTFKEAIRNNPSYILGREFWVTKWNPYGNLGLDALNGDETLSQALANIVLRTYSYFEQASGEHRQNASLFTQASGTNERQAIIGRALTTAQLRRIATGTIDPVIQGAGSAAISLSVYPTGSPQRFADIVNSLKYDNRIKEPETLSEFDGALRPAVWSFSAIGTDPQQAAILFAQEVAAALIERGHLELAFQVLYQIDEPERFWSLREHLPYLLEAVWRPIIVGCDAGNSRNCSRIIDIIANARDLIALSEIAEITLRVDDLSSVMLLAELQTVSGELLLENGRFQEASTAFRGAANLLNNMPSSDLWNRVNFGSMIVAALEGDPNTAIDGLRKIADKSTDSGLKLHSTLALGYLLIGQEGPFSMIQEVVTAALHAATENQTSPAHRQMASELALLLVEIEAIAQSQDRGEDILVATRRHSASMLARSLFARGAIQAEGSEIGSAALVAIAEVLAKESDTATRFLQVSLLHARFVEAEPVPPVQMPPPHGFYVEVIARFFRLADGLLDVQGQLATNFLFSGEVIRSLSMQMGIRSIVAERNMKLSYSLHNFEDTKAVQEHINAGFRIQAEPGMNPFDFASAPRRFFLHRQFGQFAGRQEPIITSESLASAFGKLQDLLLVTGEYGADGFRQEAHPLVEWRAQRDFLLVSERRSRLRDALSQSFSEFGGNASTRLRAALSLLDTADDRFILARDWRPSIDLPDNFDPTYVEQAPLRAEPNETFGATRVELLELTGALTGSEWSAPPLLRDSEALIHIEFLRATGQISVYVAVLGDFEHAAIPLPEAELRRFLVATREMIDTQATPDHADLYEFYARIFEHPNLAPLLDEKDDWLIVPKGVFWSVPFNVLLTNPINSNPNLANFPWLSLEKRLWLLPETTLLRRYRQGFSDRAQTNGGVVTLGDPAYNDDQFECGNTLLASLDRRADYEELRKVGQRGFTPGEWISLTQGRLPCTRTEVESLSQVFAQEGRPVTTMLEQDASETKLAELVRSGILEAAEVLHVGSHGLSFEDTFGFSEPALVLTPPLGQPRTLMAPKGGHLLATALNDFWVDDGLWRASEIRSLNLNARLGILSACNTGIGRGRLGRYEGLVSAFLLAGVERLLVTNWYVHDEAGAFLINEVVSSAGTEFGDIAFAKRLQKSMRSLITAGDNGSTAHPYYWAPYFIVGAPD